MYKEIKLLIILRGGYAYSKGYVYCFCQMFQGLCLFKGVCLFRTLEYKSAQKEPKIVQFSKKNAKFPLTLMSKEKMIFFITKSDSTLQKYMSGSGMAILPT